MSLFFCLFTFGIDLWHRKFVTADITAAFVNNQHAWYSATRTRFWLKHINTLSTHGYTHRAIKIGALKCNLSERQLLNVRNFHNVSLAETFTDVVVWDPWLQLMANT